MKKISFFLCIFFLLGFINSASAITIGNDVIDRSYLDGATNIAFIDPTLVFPTDGTLNSFSIYFKSEGSSEFALQIYEPTTDVNEWKLVYTPKITFGGFNGLLNANISSPGFQLKAGDVIGWWFGSQGGVIPYDKIGPDDVDWTNYNSLPINNPVVGDTYNFDTASWNLTTQEREYSISADYTPASVPEPATMLLLGCGLIGLAGFGKKFKKA